MVVQGRSHTLTIEFDPQGLLEDIGSEVPLEHVSLGTLGEHKFSTQVGCNYIR